MEERRFAAVELIPGKLAASVFEHSLDLGSSALPCWTYMSRGLAAQGQKEIVLTVQRWPDAQAPPSAPLTLFANVYVLASQDHRVDAGDATEFGGEDSLLGRQAILYLPAQRLLGIELPEPALAAVLLPSEEMDAARRFGPMRVVGRLARAYGFRPFPLWSDVQRRALTFEESAEQSILTRVPVVGNARARIVCRDRELTLRIDPRATPELRDGIRSLPEAEPFALWTGPDSEADVWLAWDPTSGTEGAGIPTSGGAAATTAGCFLAIEPGHAQNSGRVVEDGFELRLMNEAWFGLRAALLSGRPAALALADGVIFHIEWCTESHAQLLQGTSFDSGGRVDLSRNIEVEPLGGVYASPIDGTQYHSSGGWRRYSPDADAEPEPSGARWSSSTSCC